MRFVLASQEGLWIYQLRYPGDSELLSRANWDDVATVARPEVERLLSKDGVSVSGNGDPAGTD